MGGSFDVVVIGAGINGATVSHALASRGYHVLLVDQGDFGSGTSQASTMLIWGGLLYLKNLELATVLALTRDRDRLVAERPASVQARPLLYVPSSGPPRFVVESALAAYWIMGAGTRARPERLDDYPEQAYLTTAGPAYAIEEAALVTSDARFVLEWALAAERLGADVRNHVRVDAITRTAGDGPWRLRLCDVLTGATSDVRARMVVNAAGCWTDAVNEKAGLTSPWRHAFSRGVSLSFPRPAWHTRHLVLDSLDGDVMTLAPWGPVSLWGSTDTLHADLAEARQPSAGDVADLLDELNRHLARPVGRADIISIRTGVRPVPVRTRATPHGSSQALTRHHRLHLDAAAPWLSVYGGKLSGCLGLAAEVCALVAERVAPRHHGPAPAADAAATACPRVTTTFPTLDEPVVSAAWAAAHEHCTSLDDYLRRRTNIAQWVPRGGFGARGEHTGALERVALEIHAGDEGLAERDLARYWAQVCATDDVVTPAHAARPIVPRWRTT